MAGDESNVVTYAVSECSLNKSVLRDTYTPSVISKHKFRSIKAGVWLFITVPIFLFVFCRQFSPTNSNASCLPNGDFIPDGSPIYDYAWDFSFIVDITLGWGRFPFKAVKVIDVIFDVVVGRGGQALAAWISYSILSKALLHSMDCTPTSFDHFIATSYKIGSLTALWAGFREIFSKKPTQKRRPTWILIATIFVSIYLISFSTIISAISGYQALATAYVTGPDGSTMIRHDDLQHVIAIVKDGSRIGLTDNYHLVQGSMPTIEDNPANRLFYNLAYVYYNRSSETALPSSLDCPDAPSSSYTQLCGPLDQSSNITVYGKNYDLDSPSLTITYLDGGYSDPNSLFIHNGTILTLNWIANHGSCQPTNAYEWGFSFLGLLFFLIYTSCTTFVLYLVWRDTYWSSRSPRAEQGIGPLRAALDLSRSLRAELGDECEDYTNAELSEQIKARCAKMRLVGDEWGWDMNRRELEKLAKQEKKERKKKRRPEGSMGVELLASGGESIFSVVR